MRRRETEGGIYNNAPLPSFFHDGNDGGKDGEHNGERTCAREKKIDMETESSAETGRSREQNHNGKTATD